MSNRDLIKALVPQAKKLAEIFGEEGITASTVRRAGIRLGLITDKTPTHWLSSVMKQAGLYTYGNTRPSTIESTKGRRQLVWYAGADPYAD